MRPIKEKVQASTLLRRQSKDSVLSIYTRIVERGRIATEYEGRAPYLLMLAVNDSWKHQFLSLPGQSSSFLGNWFYG